MTREEAIKRLSKYVNNGFYTIEHQETCAMAIAALREQEERSKGCEHCRSEINRRMMRAHGYSYCTDCGRRLEDV